MPPVPFVSLTQFLQPPKSRVLYWAIRTTVNLESRLREVWVIWNSDPKGDIILGHTNLKMMTKQISQAKRIFKSKTKWNLFKVVIPRSQTQGQHQSEYADIPGHWVISHLSLADTSFTSKLTRIRDEAKAYFSGDKGRDIHARGHDLPNPV